MSPSKNELEPSSSGSESIHGSTDKDVDLKQYIDKEVTCVDFSIDRGEAGLTLTLANKIGLLEGQASVSVDSELSIEELADIEEVWTPVAARTRSRLKG